MSLFKPIPRRTFLAGAGATIALPFLDAMLPRRSRAATPPPPRRLFVFNFPTGVNQSQFWPTGQGTTFALSPTLMPLQPFQSEIVVLGNVANRPAETPSRIGTGHAQGVAAFLTGTYISGAFSALSNNISMDQLLAKNLGQYTKFPSLELGTKHERDPNSVSDTPLQAVFSDNINWAGPGMPLPKEIDPQALFMRLFSVSAPTNKPDYRKSILDGVIAQATSLQGKLGKNDQYKVQEYLDSVRAIEKQIQSGGPVGTTCTPPTSAPAAYLDIRDHVTQLLDLSVLALQCDLTRVISFSFEYTGCLLNFPFIYTTGEEYHLGISHHGNDPTKLAKYAAVNKWFVQQLAYLLTKMQAVVEPDGTLLDNSIVFFSSELGDGDSHSHDHMPIVVAGRGGKKLTTGRYINYATEQPLANLYISLLSLYGVSVTKFGDNGTGPLMGL